MINDIKLDDDAIENLGLWWPERPTVIFSKFITTAVHKQHKLHDLYIYICIKLSYKDLYMPNIQSEKQ